MENLDSIEPALANIGDVDLLVNNAGIAYLADFVDHDVVETERCVACVWRSFAPCFQRARLSDTLHTPPLYSVMRVNSMASMIVGQVRQSITALLLPAKLSQN